LLTLTDKEEEELEKEINTYFEIAKANGSILSMEGLVELMDVDADQQEVERVIRASPSLKANILLSSGYVFRRSGNLGSAQIESAVQEQEERKRRAISNLRTADDFSRWLGKRAVMVAVGGTNSYLSPREKDDIDLFCVTRRGTMWTFMLESLVKARVYGLLHKGTPQLCFSFIMDEGWAEREFGKTQDAIFARDVLTSKVVGGRDVYDGLIRRASWMERFFPRLYRMRPGIGDGAREGTRSGGSDSKGETTSRKVVNGFLYATLGSYILLKAWHLNRRFAKEGRGEANFTTDIGGDHCVYESNKYKRLRRMYAPLHER
jgi:hypothetical protein